MIKDKEVAEYVRKAGAVHWKEVAQHFSLPTTEPAEVVACLSGLVSSGVLSSPWTTQRTPYIWYRHSKTKYQMAGKLRAESRAKYPELWSEPKRQREASIRRDQKEKLEQERLDFLFGYMRSEGAQSVWSIVDMLQLGEASIRRRLKKLEDEGLVEKVPQKSGKRGRPEQWWQVTDEYRTPMDPQTMKLIEYNDDVELEPDDMVKRYVSGKVEIEWEDDT